MQIIWKGHACFKAIVQRKKAENIEIVFDPFDEEVGLRLSSLSADILLLSHLHYDHNNLKAVKDGYFLIDGPGEYEIKNVFVRGISAFHDNEKGKQRGNITIYTVEAEQIRLCHLGDIGQEELTSEQLEEIGDIDVLMIPVGGKYTIDGLQAAKIVNQIEPKIVIPMHYQIPKLKIKLDKVGDFLKAMGVSEIEPQEKLTIKKNDLLKEELEVVVLNP